MIENMSIKINIPRITNQILLCVLATLLIYTPAFEYKKLLYIGGIFALWFFTSLLLDGTFLFNSINEICYVLFFVFIDFLVWFLNGDTSYLFLGINKVPVFMWLIVFCFYSQKTDIVKKPLVIIFLLMAVSSVYTLNGNITYPGASRLLAGVVKAFEAERTLYKSLNIGGYGFIYSLVFFTMPLLLMIKYKVLCGVWNWIYFGLLVSTVVVGSYFTGILLMIAMIFCAMIEPKRLDSYILSIIIICVAMLVLKDTVMEVLSKLGKSIGSEMLVRHSNDIIEMDYLDEYGDANRFQIYLNSILNFVDRPFFGVLQGNEIIYRRSGHSALLGYLECYGLLSFVYFAFFKYAFKVTKSLLKTKVIKNYYTVYFSFIILFLLVNIFDAFPEVGMMVFFVGPITMLVIDDKLKEKYDNESIMVNK